MLFIVYSTHDTHARFLHVPAVLTADLEERLRDLPQARHLDRLHQLLEDVAATARHVLQALERRRRLRGVLRLEGVEPRQAALLLLVRRAGDLHVERVGVVWLVCQQRTSQ